MTFKMCPELQGVSNSALHDVKKLSDSIREMKLDYPGLVVDYKKGRDRALKAFKSS